MGFLLRFVEDGEASEEEEDAVGVGGGRRTKETRKEFQEQSVSINRSPSLFLS